MQNPVLRGDQIDFTFTADVDGAPIKHEFGGRVEGDAHLRQRDAVRQNAAKPARLERAARGKGRRRKSKTVMFPEFNFSLDTGSK